jgi:hypothetical protein
MDRIAGVRVELMQLMWCSVMWKVESVRKMLDDRTVRCPKNARPPDLSLSRFGRTAGQARGK